MSRKRAPRYPFQGGTAQVDFEGREIRITVEGGTYTPLERAQLEADLLAGIVRIVGAVAGEMEAEAREVGVR